MILPSDFVFFTATIKFIRIDVIRYGAEPMQLRCGASQSFGRCSNRQSTVKVQGRESEVRGLVVLSGLPVSKGSPIRDERALGLLVRPLLPRMRRLFARTTAIDIRTLT